MHSALTELPVIGIVYVFRVRKYCRSEERPQHCVRCREQNIREYVKSALGWTGLTRLNRVNKFPISGFNKKKSPHSEPSLECSKGTGLIHSAIKRSSSVQATFKCVRIMISPIAIKYILETFPEECVFPSLDSSP